MNSYTFLALLFTGCAMWTHVLRSRDPARSWLGVPLWIGGATFMVAALAAGQDLVARRTEQPDPSMTTLAENLRWVSLLAHAAWLAILFRVHTGVKAP